MSAKVTDEDLAKALELLGVNSWFGLRWLLESLKVPELLAAFRAEARREVHACSFSTGIDGSITAGSGELDANGYWSQPCEPCAKWANKCEQARLMGQQSEREAYERIVEDWVADTCEWLLKMERTADPGTDKPVNFEPDKRTRVAIAAWLLDSRKAELLCRLRERAK